MRKRKSRYFIAMHKVITESEEFDGWVFETENGEYYTAYISIDGTVGYIADEPSDIDTLNFTGETRLFDTPWIY